MDDLAHGLERPIALLLRQKELRGLGHDASSSRARGIRASREGYEARDQARDFPAERYGVAGSVWQTCLG